MSSHCSHCWPTRTSSHLTNHMEYYQEKFARILKPFVPRTKKQSNFWGNFLELLAKLNLVEFVDNPDHSRLYNRSLIFFKEAKKRGLQIQAVKAFGKYDNSFKVFLKNKPVYYDGIPLNIIGKKNNHDLDNKIEIKKLLQKNKLPVADGGLFTRMKEASQFAEIIGFPVIVKPNNGSLSHHVSGPIGNLKALKSAIKIVQQYRPDFIVEKFIRGKLYRATVIGKKHVFICRKEPANVVGNGKSTIAKLIELKNQTRGKLEKLNETLHKIPVGTALKERLQLKRLNLNSVLPKEKKLYLQDKIILSTGCDVIACTEITHENNINMFLHTAKILNSDLVGIDFIGQNITKDFKNQTSAIIETNSLPYIDMHQYPSHGKAHPVAKIIWDSILKTS